MSQQPPDEEFERRLRDVFRSRGLGIPVPPDALDRIHSGARRRQQRRTVTSVTAAFLVVAITGVGVGIRNIEHHGGNDQIAAGSRTPVSSPVPSPTASVGDTSPGPVPSASERPSPPASKPPTVVPAAPTTYPKPGSAVPADFSPISVTAVNDNAYWVLGTQQCGQQTCTAIVQTTDGGSNFTELAAPHAATITIDNDTRVVRGLRFADNENGWAYGQALWTTADGGASWTDTSLPAGGVFDLGAARAPGAVAGTVWAVVQPDPFSSGYQLWRAPYGSGSGTGAWQRVDLGSDPPSADSQPSLVAQGGTAYLLALDNAHATHLYVASAGATTTMLNAPCTSPDSNLSAGIGSLWTMCSTGGSGGGPHALVSTDGGVSWQSVTAPSAYSLGSVGGIDATAAMVEMGSGLTRVSTGAAPKAATIANKTTGFIFIGFTDAKTGFALSQPDPERLWRTTDGGLTWKAVTF